MNDQITDVEKMINKTKDTKNDICLKSRSEIIEKVAKLPFRTFMQEVNAVVENAVLLGDSSFFDERYFSNQKNRLTAFIEEFESHRFKSKVLAANIPKPNEFYKKQFKKRPTK